MSSQIFWASCSVLAATMSDSEVPAKNELGDPSGVNVGVNEVVPEIPGHTRKGRNQNTVAAKVKILEALLLRRYIPEGSPPFVCVPLR